MISQIATRVVTGQASSSLFGRPDRLVSRSVAPRGVRRKHALVVRASDEATPARIATGLAWASIIGYAAAVAPSGSEALDAKIVTDLIQSPFTGTVNYLFESQFNALGIMPAVYASLLMPGAKDQKPVPTVPFLAASFALGYFAIGPYLTFREIRDEPVQRSSLGWVTRNILEAKWNAALLLAFAGYLIYNAGAHLSPALLADYSELWHTQALVNVSSVDLVVLSFAVYLPMVEDMKRRGWGDKRPLAAAFTAVPVVGPVVYLLLRPSLEE